MIAAVTSPMDRKARISGGEDVELKKPTSSSPLDEVAVDEGDVDVSVCKAIAGGGYVDRVLCVIITWLERRRRQMEIHGYRSVGGRTLNTKLGSWGSRYT